MAEKAVPIVMYRRGTFLAPHSPFDCELVEAYPVEVPLKVTISQPRNIGRLRLYFALLGVVIDNMDDPPTKDKLHEAIKIRLGRCTTVKFKDGRTVEIADSVAFDKMSEVDFQDFLRDFKALMRINPAMERAATEKLGKPL